MSFSTPSKYAHVEHSIFTSSADCLTVTWRSAVQVSDWNFETQRMILTQLQDIMFQTPTIFTTCHGSGKRQSSGSASQEGRKSNEGHQSTD